ncbi:glycosyltransferase [Pseudomonas amygdali]|uniref:glycosyltransferase n=1 Tax=Pseudomonas amygdali TaxID=47877 RepID=UPI0034DCD1F7
MKIAQVAPLFEAVPPQRYGGTERVVSYPTEALVELGHQVTLFASGDSLTSAELDAVWPAALRLDYGSFDVISPHLVMMERVRRRAQEFDIIHFHPPGLLPLLPVQPPAHTVCYHLAWSSRSARTQTGVQYLCRHAAYFDFQRSTQ